MKLKRILAVLLVVCMMMPLVACGKDSNSTVTTTAPEDTATTTTVAQGVVSDTDEVTSGTDEVTTATDEQGEIVTEPGETEPTEQTEQTEQADQGGDVDVAPEQTQTQAQQQQGGNVNVTTTTQAQQQQQQGGNVNVTTTTKAQQQQQQGGNVNVTTTTKAQQQQQQGGNVNVTTTTKAQQQQQQGGNVNVTTTTQAQQQQQQGGNVNVTTTTKAQQQQQQGGNVNVTTTTKAQQQQQQGGNVNVTTTTIATTTQAQQQQQQGATTTRATKSKVSLNIQTQPSKGTSASLAHVTVREGDTKMEEGLNFGGKTFRFCTQGSGYDPNGAQGQRIAAFCEYYNLKLDVDVAAISGYPAHVAAAMAAGTPYDIMFLYGWNYPSQIMSNAMTPLDDYITTADLWDENSMKEGGLSYSLADTFSLNGKIYCAGGTYLQTAFVVWYNKKLFSAAGYDGADDPLALYNKGQWTWEKLYEMLQDIQDPDKGLYGLNSICPYYDHPFICTYDTDFAKRTDEGKVVQNLNDPQLYAAYNMLQKLCFGKQKVADPSNQYEDGSEQFMNGTIAACTGTAGWAWSIYEKMDAKHYSAFGSQAEQKKNVGMVPAPVANKNGVHAIWDWMGYGAGNGATEDGIKAAVAFAKWDSKYNQKQAYHPEMPADIKAAALGVLDSDKLRGPMDGYKSSAGSLGGIGTSISEAIARSGGNITVTLKGYEKMAQTVVDTALKH